MPVVRLFNIGGGIMSLGKVLLIDDEKEYCQILEKFFTLEGFQVECAHDGEGGVLKAIDWEPEVVVLDIRMPKKGGMYFLENFIRPTKTRIIVVSALQDQDILEKCVELGADDYISKPIDVMELKAKIEDSLKLSCPPEPAINNLSDTVRYKKL